MYFLRVKTVAQKLCNTKKIFWRRNENMKQTYSLTAAQNMHYQWIKEYKTQQVSGLSIVAAFQAETGNKTVKIEKLEQLCACSHRGAK